MLPVRHLGTVDLGPCENKGHAAIAAPVVPCPFDTEEADWQNPWRRGGPLNWKMYRDGEHEEWEARWRERVTEEGEHRRVMAEQEAEWAAEEAAAEEKKRAEAEAFKAAFIEATREMKEGESEADWRLARATGQAYMDAHVARKRAAREALMGPMVGVGVGLVSDVGGAAARGGVPVAADSLPAAADSAPAAAPKSKAPSIDAATNRITVLLTDAELAELDRQRGLASRSAWLAQPVRAKR